MRALIALTVGMGVLIVAGTATLGVVIVRRLGAPPPTFVPLALDEPAGTHIAGVSAIGEHLALRLEGGGPDRVVMIDPAHARILGHITLSH